MTPVSKLLAIVVTNNLNVTLVKFLIDNGANVNITNIDELQLIYVAVQHKNIKILKY